MGGQQLLDSQGAKKEWKTPPKNPCLELCSVFILGYFFLFFFLKKDSKKYRQLIVWLLGYF